MNFPDCFIRYLWQEYLLTYNVSRVARLVVRR